MSGVRGGLVLLAWLSLGTLIVPGIVAASIADPAGANAVVGIAASAILVAFWWRPIPTLLWFAYFMLFIDTTEGYVGSAIKQTDEVAIIGLVAITVFRRRRALLGRISILREASLVGIVTLALVSSLANDVPVRLWAPGLVLLLKGLAFFYVVLHQRITERDVRSVATVVVAMSIGLLVGGVVELIRPDIIEAIRLSPNAGARGVLPSIKSLFVHPVLFAWSSSFVAIYLFTGFAVTRRRWMLVLATLLSAGTILAARRRAMVALGAAVVAGLVAAAIRAPRRWTAAVRQWAMPVASLVVLFAAFQPGLTALYERTINDYVPQPSPTERPTAAPGETLEPLPSEDPDDDGLADTSTPARLALYRGAVEIATDEFPLGAGLGRYGSWMSRVEYSPLYVEYGLSKVYGLRPKNPKFATDTFWPQIAGELGWLGVAAYGGFLGAIGLGLWRASRRAWPSPLMTVVVTGSSLVLVQSLVESLASAMFHSPARVYLALGAMALALAAAHTAEEEDGGPAPLPDPLADTAAGDG